MMKKWMGVLQQTALVQFVVVFSLGCFEKHALAEDSAPQMAKPFMQKSQVRKKPTSTAVPVRRTIAPTPVPIQAPEATPVPRTTQTRSSSPRSSSAGGAVDLSTLTTSDSSSASTKGASVSKLPKMTHGSSGVFPNFKFYFDFLLRYAPGVDSQATVSFDSFHQIMMVEIAATPELSFITELSTAPRFFEVDYQSSERVTLRWGKIWIPFDDMAPHNIFGGRINTSRLFENTSDRPFLPDLWAELGVGAKIMLSDSSAAATQLDLYVTNGIGSGGSDPTGSGTAYPNFANSSIGADNNNDKSYGARLSGKFFQRASLGFSAYRGNWTDKSTPNKGITLLGFDTQIRPTNAIELRSGVMVGDVGLNPPSAKESYSKGGAYVETGVKFGEDLNTKFLLRGGVAQNDSRVRDNSDRKIVGATLLKRFGPIEASLQYSRDLQRFAGKDFYNFGAFRVVAAF